MFSCMSGGSVSHGASVDEHTITRIIDESERLKQKCKSLRALLLETENKRSEESAQYQVQIAKLKGELDVGIADLQAQKFVELSEMRDYRTSEVYELQDLLSSARNELSMQGALIIALTRKVTYLEREAEDSQQRYHLQLERLKHEHAEEIDQLSMPRTGTQPLEQHTQLVRRALAAEAEVANLKASNRPMQPASPTEVTMLKEAIARASAANEGVQEELRQTRERCCILEERLGRLQAERDQRSEQEGNIAATAQAPLVSPRLNGLASPRDDRQERRELRAAREQVAQLQQQLQEVLETRAAVELAVRGVVADNERLSREVEDLSAQLQTR